MTERLWIIAAALLVLVAGVCLWRNNLSVAFVTATLGACAWFLSYRAQLRAKIVAREEHEAETQTDEDTDED
jgi:uncharacterized membrane protein YdjX (TVP38/TMEM64 family)